ncbi:hypothetical protein PFICI_12257 [Pestalotiopsis fici W106-1]|uniref:Uncharacterized protein n=1 Tax=Pestalotiopsis fici (strain W106-1 / CGMCC3.15140) TaxID=1229662 RepID=W3WN78_PESFW|nr:uncharacterized protein PFICI_12257 [Pestalotiopsis fici W106-1]ETS75313.1 hypothetical protein PFICI_12257 [Pestalotiopsis fici W106-1]
MAMLESILSGLQRITDDGELAPDLPDATPDYLNWGFTIYRTEYGGSSDESWLALLDNIQAQIAEELQAHQDDEENDEQRQMAETLQALFRLDTHSDITLLQDKPMDDLRELFLRSVEDDHGAFRPHQCGYFLLADSEVLQDAGRAVNPEFWVKCVQGDYVAANYTPKNNRMGGQRYFGWMKMTTRSMLELWDQLNVRDLASLAPKTIGGLHVTTWNGELS